MHKRARDKDGGEGVERATDSSSLSSLVDEFTSGMNESNEWRLSRMPVLHLEERLGIQAPTIVRPFREGSFYCYQYSQSGEFPKHKNRLQVVDGKMNNKCSTHPSNSKLHR